MFKVKENIVIDEKGRKSSVILKLKDYEKLVDYVEDLEDVVAYDKARSKAGDSLSFDEAVKEIERKYGTRL